MNKNDKIYLLLTGTINANRYGTNCAIRDTEVRLNEYEHALQRYICSSPFTDIVFIENSEFSFNVEKYESLAKQHNKRFEFISGTPCVDEVKKYGRSYGDAFLIHEALHKSKLLEKAEYFYKITGRIFLINSDRIVKTRLKNRNEFICYTYSGWCFTNIFKANTIDYLKYFDDVYLYCDESKVDDIEIMFYKILAENDIETASFKTYPYFDGVMGGTGKRYSGGKIERIIRNAMARMNCFDMNSFSSRFVYLIMRILGRKNYKK